MSLDPRVWCVRALHPGVAPLRAEGADACCVAGGAPLAGATQNVISGGCAILLFVCYGHIVALIKVMLLVVKGMSHLCWPTAQASSPTALPLRRREESGTT